MTNILLENGYTFTVRKSQSHKDKLVYCFVVGADYPNVGPVVHYGKDDVLTSMEEVKRANKGKIIVLYDTTQDRLLGVSIEVLDLVQTAKREAVKKVFSQPKIELKLQLDDEYGRQFQMD